MNDDLTERAYAPRRSLITIAALVAVLKNFDQHGTNLLTSDLSPYTYHDDEPVNRKETKK